MQDPVLAEHLSGGICRLRQSVCIHEDFVPGFQGKLILLIGHVFQAADHEAVFILEQREFTVLHQSGVFVSCIRCREFAGADLQNSDPDGNEHVHLIVAAEGFIGFCKDIGRSLPQHGAALHDDFGNHHKQRGGNALATDIGNHQAKMILIDQEKVVKVSAYLPGGIHGCVNVKLRPLGEWREFMRQHASLDPACHFQLCIQPLLLQCFPVLDFQPSGFSSVIPQDTGTQREHSRQQTGNVEERLFIEGLLFDDLHGIGFAAVFEGILHIHDELISTARQVRVHHRSQIFPAHGCGLSVKSLHLVRDIRI